MGFVGSGRGLPERNRGSLSQHGWLALDNVVGPVELELLVTGRVPARIGPRHPHLLKPAGRSQADVKREVACAEGAAGSHRAVQRACRSLCVSHIQLDPRPDG